MSKKIIYKTPQQIAHIRESGKYLTQLLHLIREHALPGVSLLELEEQAETFIRKHHLKGAFKGYGGFPANLCLSVNDCVVHGIPDATILKPGDLLKIDAWINYKEGISDAAISIVIGGESTNDTGAHLARTTKSALDKGVQKVWPGISLIDYAQAVFDEITDNGCSIIKNLTGHGVGVDVHEWPTIYNWPNTLAQQETFQPNMVVALEPITAITSTRFVEHPHQEWNLYTDHGDLWAQREYTVLITENWIEILAWVQ